MEHPVVRGGLTIGAGIIAGNLLGFARVAVTAYLLGTHSRADALAVAVGPVDSANGVLLNAIVFSFVPLLSQREGAARDALFRRLRNLFVALFAALSGSAIVLAPWILKALAPGLAVEFFPVSVNLLRIVALSSLAAGFSAIHAAMLYTDRRFAPAAFSQAVLNACTIAGALLLWQTLGIYGFAIGYAAGAWIQAAVVWIAVQRGRAGASRETCAERRRDLLARPAAIVLYATALSLNITFTRAYATHVGPGMAAALEYCMRGVNVPLAFLVSPLSNSLLPEIARLRGSFRLPQALRLIDRTVGLAAMAAVTACAVAIAFREPVIRLMFQRGSFTAESTALVSAVFLGLAPSLIGWSLLEITSRGLFALDRPWLPAAVALLPLGLNMAVTLAVRPVVAHMIGMGASLGLLVGFGTLILLTNARRGAWLSEAGARPAVH